MIKFNWISLVILLNSIRYSLGMINRKSTDQRRCSTVKTFQLTQPIPHKEIAAKTWQRPPKAIVVFWVRKYRLNICLWKLPSSHYFKTTFSAFLFSLNCFCFPIWKVFFSLIFLCSSNKCFVYFAFHSETSRKSNWTRFPPPFFFVPPPTRTAVRCNLFTI